MWEVECRQGRNRAETPEAPQKFKTWVVVMTEWRGSICTLEAESTNLAVD